MLTNPTAIMHQNLSMAMKNTPEEKEVSKNTLMGPPKKQMTKAKEDDILQPSRRIASYIDTIQKKREEIKNG
jgi:hypothetical protein